LFFFKKKFFCKGEDVALAAAELLNDLFLFPHQKGNGLREAHITKCMQALQIEKVVLILVLLLFFVKTKEIQGGNVFRVLRALRMLCDMHDAYDKIGSSSPSAKQTNNGGGMIGGGPSRLNLFVRIDVGNGFLLPDVEVNTTIEQLKKMIGDRLGGMAGMFMRLFIEDKELTSLKSTLSQVVCLRGKFLLKKFPKKKCKIYDKTEIIVRQSSSLSGKDDIGIDSLGGMLVQSILKGLFSFEFEFEFEFWICFQVLDCVLLLPVPALLPPVCSNSSKRALPCVPPTRA
jgi:hypothetical protein